MAKKKSSKPRPPPSETRAYPSFHKSVSSAVSDYIPSLRYIYDEHRTPIEEYSTHIMGRFRCSTGACSTAGWASRKVAILIRSYPRDGYNATVFGQRCKSCGALGWLTVDKESYVARVEYRVKKWAGIEMEQPEYGGADGKPHERQFCEGCRRGICRAAGFD